MFALGLAGLAWTSVLPQPQHASLPAPVATPLLQDDEPEETTVPQAPPSPSVLETPAAESSPSETPKLKLKPSASEKAAGKASPFGPIHLPLGSTWSHASFRLLAPVEEPIHFKSPTRPAPVDGVEIRPAADGFVLTVQRPGQFTVAMMFPPSHGQPVQRSLEVEARNRAGRFPAVMLLRCSPGQPWGRWLWRELLGHLQPLARLSMEDLPATVAQPHRVLVTASGPDLMTYQAPLAVDLEAAPEQPQPAVGLLLSNRPEKVHESSLLLSRDLAVDGPVRLMIHHKLMPDATVPGENLELRLTNLGQKVARFQLALELVGPSNDEIFAGHAALARFLAPVCSLHQEAGCEFELAPGQPRTLERWPMKPGYTVSGYGMLTPLDGSTPLRVEVAVRRPDEPIPALVVPYDSVDERTSRGYFPADQTATYTHRAGTTYLFVGVGDKPYASDATTREQDVGNFGVLQQLNLTLSNPTPEPREFRLEISARGGPARGFFLIDGHLLESGLLSSGGQTLERWTLAAGEERKVTLQTLPQAGSNYPVTVSVGDYPVGPPRDPGVGTDLTFLP